MICDRSVITYINELATGLLGYSPEELIGQSIQDLYFDPTEYDQIRQHAHQTIAQKEEFIFQLQGKTKSGQPIPLQIAGQLNDPDVDSHETLWLISPLHTTVPNVHALEEAKQLKQRLHDTERFNRLATEREFRVIELKGEVNNLAKLSGQPIPYDSFINPKFTGKAPNRSEQSVATVPPLAELVDLRLLKSLLDFYCKTAGVAAAIISLEGKVLVQCGWQFACSDFHRKAPQSLLRCEKSDRRLADQLAEGQQIAHHRCENGLNDAASPIRVKGTHLGNVFMGQFFDQSPDMDFFSNLATECGYDLAPYLKAIENIPVIEPQATPNIFGFLSGFCTMIEGLALDRLKASDAIDHANQQSIELSKERSALLSLAEDAELARSQTAKYQDRLELLVEARTEELNEANLAKDRILSIISHDLRGPIGNFSVVFDLVSREEMPLDKGLAKSIAASASNLNSLLDDLLSWTRHQGGLLRPEPKVFWVDEVLVPTLDLLKTSAQSKSIQLTYESSDPLYCFADPALISTVLRNLIGNAIKFTPQGGHIEVSCEAIEHKARFKIADSGTGLHHDDLRQLLLGSGTAMSKRGTAYEQGTGLGLTLCRDFLKLSNSVIEAHSQMGQGTQFWFDLELKDKAEATPCESSGLPGNLGHFLLVEGDPISLKTSSLVLKGMDIPYHVARNGSSAIAAANKANYQVVLVDVDSPGLNSVEAAEYLLEKSSPPPLVIGLTKYDKDEINERFGPHRFSAVLERPLNPHQLGSLLNILIPTPEG